MSMSGSPHGEAPFRVGRLLLIVGIVGGLPIALYVATCSWAVWGFTRSNRNIEVLNACPWTVSIDVAGKIGSDGFVLAPGEAISVERPYTNDVRAWRETPVDNPDMMRIPLPEDAEAVSIAGDACPT
jgi:hypothetical protein